MLSQGELVELWRTVPIRGESKGEGKGGECSRRTNLINQGGKVGGPQSEVRLQCPG